MRGPMEQGLPTPSHNADKEIRQYVHIAAEAVRGTRTVSPRGVWQWVLPSRATGTAVWSGSNLFRIVV